MNTKQINVKVLEERLQNAFYEKQKLLEVELEECRNAFTNPEDNTYIEDKVDNFEKAIRKILAYNTNKDAWKNRITAAHIFNDMTYTLTHEFGEKVIVDMEHFVIRFPWSGNTVSFPVRMLAKMHNLHSGMFGFDSDLTTHEAYTEDNYKIRIGIDEDNNSMVKISFGKIDELK